MLLAEAMGLNPFEQRLAEASGLLHDIGKVGVPDKVLLKKDKLTPSEEALMREHVPKGEAVIRPLSHIPFFRAVLPAIRHHHERIDGAGYPEGLKGDQIPFLARLVTVVDAVDAITTRRPYQVGNAMEFAYSELKRCSGTQFDPALVEVFLRDHPTWGEFPDDITELGIERSRRKSG
jgi:HD-GYP domain-containing protein (c-di-GMP phosphodiesterase class II)